MLVSQCAHEAIPSATRRTIPRSARRASSDGAYSALYLVEERGDVVGIDGHNKETGNAAKGPRVEIEMLPAPLDHEEEKRHNHQRHHYRHAKLLQRVFEKECSRLRCHVG